MACSAWPRIFVQSACCTGSVSLPSVALMTRFDLSTWPFAAGDAVAFFTCVMLFLVMSSANSVDVKQLPRSEMILLGRL